MGIFHNLFFPPPPPPEEDPIPTIIPEGNYPCVIMGVREKTSQRGRTYLHWEFGVLDADIDSRFRLHYVTPLEHFPSLWRLKDLIEAATGRTLPTGKNIRFAPEECVGKNATCVVTHVMYANNKRCTVSAVRKMEEVMKKRVTIYAAPGVNVERTNFGGWTFEGELNVEVEDLETVVRVRFMEGTRDQNAQGYCYNDPSRNLEIGDIVDVSTCHASSNMARVIGFGLGSFKPNGRLRDVRGKYTMRLRDL